MRSIYRACFQASPSISWRCKRPGRTGSASQLLRLSALGLSLPFLSSISLGGGSGSSSSRAAPGGEAQALKAGTSAADAAGSTAPRQPACQLPGLHCGWEELQAWLEQQAGQHPLLTQACDLLARQDIKAALTQSSQQQASQHSAQQRGRSSGQRGHLGGPAPGGTNAIALEDYIQHPGLGYDGCQGGWEPDLREMIAGEQGALQLELGGVLLKQASLRLAQVAIDELSKPRPDEAAADELRAAAGQLWSAAALQGRWAELARQRGGMAGMSDELKRYVLC